jgi:hypothetical protein
MPLAWFDTSGLIGADEQLPGGEGSAPGSRWMIERAAAGWYIDHVAAVANGLDERRHIWLHRNVAL